MLFPCGSRRASCGRPLDAAHSPALGAHLSGRLLDRYVRGRPVGDRARQREDLLAGNSGGPAESRPTSAPPGAASSLRMDRGAPAISSTRISRPTCRAPERRSRPTRSSSFRRRPPLAAAEAAAISAYWQAIWLADGDATQQQAAAAALTAAVGPARAADAHRRLSALQSRRPADAAADQDRRRALHRVRDLSSPIRRPRQAPGRKRHRCRQFPERFVVLGYNGGADNAGGDRRRLITLPLYVGPDPSADPSADPTSAIHPDGGDLFVPDQLEVDGRFRRGSRGGNGDSHRSHPGAGSKRFRSPDRARPATGRARADGQAALEELLRHHAHPAPAA